MSDYEKLETTAKLQNLDELTFALKDLKDGKLISIGRQDFAKFSKDVIGFVSKQHF